MSTSNTLGRTGGYVFSYGSTLFFLIPVYLLVNLAIRPAGDFTPAFIPSTRTTGDNFVQVWTQSGLPAAIATSMLITTVSCIAIMVIATMAAYPLARSTAKLSTTTFYFFLIGLLVPAQVALLPLYLTMRDLGLLGTPWALIIIYVGGNMPFAIFLTTTFLRSSVPLEYEEAARIDGCSDARVFFNIVLPLLRPVLGTLIILVGVGIWNDFFSPLLYLAGSGITTIPVAIYQFVGAYSTNWSLIFAALIISMVPVLTIYLVFQRYVIQGFAGGLKG
ncbi:carbohydrate ABC transporter permease [Plantibacter sp. 2H11-2]|uniref:carbohydrate ABC transporter permease n=1 Tax=Plantibacter sp. 2H11-2 TaxID=3414431 RepID=UPI003CE913AA